jgi:transcriptional regulator with XRE-family HTH domain
MEETEHWRLRLIELQKALGYKQAAMAKDMDVDASYFSRLLYPPGKPGRKNLGMDTMRAARKAYGLRADWFDLPLGSALPSRRHTPGASTHPALRAAESLGTYENKLVIWPFQATSQQRLQALLDGLDNSTKAEVLDDLDSLLDVAVARWEQRAEALRKRAS